ncbi:MAG TPA: DUF4352 domain-containing protein [Chloroflexia bacterium]|nr:DUF4352 domain-containing protein [Chloroflexia bacterium]
MHIRRIQRIALSSLLLTSLALGAFIGLNNHSSNAPTAVAADDCQTFPETGFKVCGRFLSYWLQHGGLAQQGFPISDVFEELNAPPPAGDGKVHRVQYFQRARFEEHTENQAPNDVLLGLIGSEQYQAKYKSKQFVQIRDRRMDTKVNNWTARPGYSYLILDLLITNVTPKKVTISPASITVRTAQIYDYKVADATYSLPNYLHLIDLYPGEDIGGYLVFEIANNDKATSLTIDYFDNKISIDL